MIHFITVVLSGAVAFLLPQWEKRTTTSIKHLDLAATHIISTYSPLARSSHLATKQDAQRTQRMRYEQAVEVCNMEEGHAITGNCSPEKIHSL